jgi:hypothetical protein
MNPILRNIIFNYKKPEPLSPFASSYRSAVSLWYQISLNTDAVKPMNQRAKGGNFPSMADFESKFNMLNVTYPDAGSWVAGQVTITANGTNGEHLAEQLIATHGVTPVVGRIYRVRCYIDNVVTGMARVTLFNRKSDGTFEVTVTQLTAGQSGWVICTLTPTSLFATPDIRYRISLRNSGGGAEFIGSGESARFSNLTFWDCTADFGESNCPTEAQFTTILTNNANVGYHEGLANYVLNKVESDKRKNYLKDISGRLRHGRLNNLAYAEGSGLTSYYFASDGVDDTLTYYQTALLAENTDCTLVSVFRLPTVPAVDSNIEHWITTGFNTLAVGGASIAVHMYENQLYGLVYNSVANTVEFTTATTAVANTWYRAHVVYTQSDRRARLYINGVSIGQSLALANGIKQTNGISSRFNAQDNTYLRADDAVQGIIAKALTASEVVDNCNRIAKLVPELGFAQI